MNAEIISVPAPVQFQPVKIAFTISNEKELDALWHRLNTGELPKGYMKDFQLSVGDIHTALTNPLFQLLSQIRADLAYGDDGR